MRIKPASKPGTVVVNLGRKDERLLAAAPQLVLKQILVPTDFSNCSEKALRYALAFAQQFQAHLVLLHVLELYPIDYFLGVKFSVEANDWRREPALDRLHRLSRQCASFGGVRAESVVNFGQPFQEIAHVAQERGVDLIILATHGWTGLKRFQLGSTAERVVRHAPCPVLVVREQEREFVQSQLLTKRATKNTFIHWPSSRPDKKQFGKRRKLLPMPVLGF